MFREFCEIKEIEENKKSNLLAQQASKQADNAQQFSKEEVVELDKPIVFKLKDKK